MRKLMIRTTLVPMVATVFVGLSATGAMAEPYCPPGWHWANSNCVQDGGGSCGSVPCG